MKASRSIVRCGVVVRYCCQTLIAISDMEEFADSVLGPEESVVGVDDPDGEAEVAAAARLAGIVVDYSSVFVAVELEGIWDLMPMWRAKKGC
jgi:hypothetical protein